MRSTSSITDTEKTANGGFFIVSRKPRDSRVVGQRSTGNREEKQRQKEFSFRQRKGRRFHIGRPRRAALQIYFLAWAKKRPMRKKNKVFVFRGFSQKALEYLKKILYNYKSGTIPPQRRSILVEAHAPEDGAKNPLKGISMKLLVAAFCAQLRVAAGRLGSRALRNGIWMSTHFPWRPCQVVKTPWE